MNWVQLPPAGALLNSYAAANLRWWTALGEWIDNAFDADAQTIEIEFAKTSIRIEDDGRGCANPLDMVRLGAHAKHSSTRLGRYGIGGKDAALWVGGLDSTIGIQSVHGGRQRILSVNWRSYANNNWAVKQPEDREAQKHERGTVIEVYPLQRQPPGGHDWQELLAYLGYLYSPALKQGRQVKFKKSAKAPWEPLVRWELPPFQGEHVDERVSVNGRGARVYCGVVQQGEPNPRSGFTYLHKWRVIEAASGRGCGIYSPARVCGFVDLSDAWPLAKNKDAIGKDADALYAEVERVALPVLERADVIGNEIRSQQFQSEVADQLNAFLAMQRAKAKRTRGTTHGTKRPTDTGGPHQQAEREQTGETFMARRSGRYVVDFVRLGYADSIGEVKPPFHVLLNLDNPMVEAARNEGDTKAVVILSACLIAVEHCYAPQGQPLLKGIPQGGSTEDISKAVGSILAGALSIDGKPALRIANG